MEQAGKQQEPKYTIVSSDVDALWEFDQKRTLFETMTKTKSFERNSKHKALYHALMESILEDEDAMDKGVAYKLKKRKPNDDKDEGPPAGPDQGLKRKKTSKEIKPSKTAKSTRTSKGTTNSQPKSTSKSAQAEETMFEAGDTQWNEGKSVENKPTHKCLSDLAKAEKPSKTFDDLMSTFIDFSAFVMNRMQISDLTQYILVGPTYELLKGTCMSYVELDYDMEECYKALTDQLDWNNPKCDRYPFDLSKPLPLVKSGNQEIEVRRSNQKLYKFKEGDFPRLHLNDIEDMLLLVVQNRLFNLEGDVLVHFAATLHPQGVIYEDNLNRKRLMLSDELYKFSDAMPRRRWSHVDKTRSHIMVKDIDRQLRERRLMRSLEKFVGGRHYGEDLRLLQRTI
ncbi:hypothetical protein Tco_1503007 [Tanacetum coccineum]